MSVCQSTKISGTYCFCTLFYFKDQPLEVGFRTDFDKKDSSHDLKYSDYFINLDIKKPNDDFM